jgi:cell division transport system permease protein
MAELPAASLRPRNADDLGLRRALADRLLPILVACMVFLAAVAVAGAVASHSLAGRWKAGAEGVLTVQVTQPDDKTPQGMTRAAAVAAVLRSSSGITTAHRLSTNDVASALKPWLGEDALHLSLALPAIFELHAEPAAAAALPGRLTTAAPGTLVEDNAAWAGRLALLGRSLQACAILVLGLVMVIAMSVVSIATRAGLAATRDAIDVLHGLGATDGMIAGRFARKLLNLTFAGALCGVLAAIPLFFALTVLSAAFRPGEAAAVLTVLPPGLWEALAALPPAAGLLGWCTAQATVRAWLWAQP